MVFEVIFQKSWKSTSFSVIFGWIVGLVAFGTSYVLFRGVPHLIGFGTIFFSVLVALPICNKLFQTEEQRERKKYKGFWHEYKHIIDFFFYWFIGLFLIYFVLALIDPMFVFSMEHAFGQKITYDTGNSISMQSIPDSVQIKSIFKNNITVMILAFFLSLAYGAGSFFLIAFNASLFASALAGVVSASFTPSDYLSTLIYLGCMISVFFLHSMAELFAYITAAIGGGILSASLSDLSITWPQLKRTLYHVATVMGTSGILLYGAAVFEVKYAKIVFSESMCIKQNHIILIVMVAVAAGIIMFEIARARKSRRLELKSRRKS